MKLLKKLLQSLRRPSTRFSLGGLLSIGTLLGVVFVGAANVAMESTNTMEFCISCHEMKTTVYEEYKESVHYSNSSGVRAECPDCHVPKQLGRKLVAKVMAVKDIWHTLIGTVDTREKFEKQRWKMASRVWAMMEAADSSTCRSCHEFDYMNLEDQPKLARRKHKRAAKDGKTCIDCHKGVAHEEPDEPEEVAVDNS